MQVVRITSFNKGIIRAASIEDAPKDSLYYAENIRFYPIGAVSRRTGAVRMFSSGVSSQILTSIHLMTFWPGDVLLFASDGCTRYWKWLGTTGDMSVVTTGYSLGSTWRGFQFGNAAYWQNGVDEPRKTYYPGTGTTGHTVREAVWGYTSTTGASSISHTDAGMEPDTSASYNIGNVTISSGFVEGNGVNWTFPGVTLGSPVSGFSLLIARTDGTSAGGAIVMFLSNTYAQTDMSWMGTETVGRPYRIDYVVPSTVPKAGDVVTLQANDSLKFAFTLKNSQYGIETNPHFSGTIGGPVGINSITYSGPFTGGDAFFDNICIYRSYNDGPYYKAQEVAVTTTSVTDTKPQAILSIAMETNHDAPPVGEVCAFWDGKAWVGGIAAQPNCLRYSLDGSPDYFPQENLIQMFASSGRPRALCPMGDRMVVLTDSGASLLRPGASAYVMDALPQADGVCGIDAWAVITPPTNTPLLVWMTPTYKIQAYNGTTVSTISEKIRPLLRPEESPIIDTTSDGMSSVFTEVDRTNGVVRFRCRKAGYTMPSYWGYTAGRINSIGLALHYNEDGLPVTVDTSVDRGFYSSLVSGASGELRAFSQLVYIWQEVDSIHVEQATTAGSLSGKIDVITLPAADTTGHSLMFRSTSSHFSTAGVGHSNATITLKNTGGDYSIYDAYLPAGGPFTTGDYVQLLNRRVGTYGAWTIGDTFEFGSYPFIVETQRVAPGEEPSKLWKFNKVQVEVENTAGDTQTRILRNRIRGHYTSVRLDDITQGAGYLLREIVIEGQPTKRAFGGKDITSSSTNPNEQ